MRDLYRPEVSDTALRRTDWVYNPAFMREHLYVAVPMALQFSVIALGLIIIQTVCNSFGSDTIAAFTSANRTAGRTAYPRLFRQKTRNNEFKGFSGEKPLFVPICIRKKTMKKFWLEFDCSHHVVGVQIGDF